MSKIKIAILGSTGMLGGMVRLFLSRQPEYELIRLDHSEEFNAGYANPLWLALKLMDCRYAVNCIGVIKPRIDEQTADSVYRAIRVNAEFPFQLAVAAEKSGCKVLQIATDCVYSGQGAGAGGYLLESSPHDAIDIYGKTKSLGEVASPAVRHLRCSIIGPEPADRGARPYPPSLLGWFLQQQPGTLIKGYTNHRWNGITTLAFARLCHGIMQHDLWDQLPPVQHVVPLDVVSKYYLLHKIACFYDRENIEIEAVTAPIAIDRSLETNQYQTNWDLWLAAGYVPRPPIVELVAEMAGYQ